MKVAYYSPWPPERTGVADYSALLLPALRERIDVEVVKRGRMKSVKGTDVALYHVGNSPEAHGWILEALRRRPGVVVLHEFVLHHLVAGLTVGRSDGPAYLSAMERDAGIAGRLLAYGTLDGSVPPLWDVRPEDFPLAGEVLDLAEEHGIIVHSHYVENRARRAGFVGPIWRIPHPAWTPPAVDPAPIKGDPLVCTFGNLNPSKRVPQLLEAFARLRETRPRARLCLVGPVAGVDIERKIEGLALEDSVIREPYVPEDRLWSLLGASDICVLLRSPTMGETSGGAIRALSLGRPLIVSDVGWFSELPGDVAFKVPVDEREVDTLAAALGLLAERADARRAMSVAARAYVELEHDLDRSAELYTAAVEAAAGGRVVQEAVVLELARRSAGLGVGLESPLAADLARALREVGLGG